MNPPEDSGPFDAPAIERPWLEGDSLSHNSKREVAVGTMAFYFEKPKEFVFAAGQRLGRIKRKTGVFMGLFMSRFLFGGALVLVMVACDRTDQKIKVYRLVKAPVESASAEQTAPAGSTAAAPQIRWELPEGWAPGAQSSMRYASFMASAENGEKADISVVTFPGDGGSDLDNVNRWGQQIGLPPVHTSEVSSVIVPLQSENISFSTTDMIGTNSHTLAAWLRRDGRSWFFKMTGPNAAVEKEKPKFVKFLQSIRF